MDKESIECVSTVTGLVIVASLLLVLSFRSCDSSEMAGIVRECVKTHPLSECQIHMRKD